MVYIFAYAHVYIMSFMFSWEMLLQVHKKKLLLELARMDLCKFTRPFPAKPRLDDFHVHPWKQENSSVNVKMLLPWTKSKQSKQSIKSAFQTCKFPNFSVEKHKLTFLSSQGRNDILQNDVKFTFQMPTLMLKLHSHDKYLILRISRAL